jgi:hypothetical protein
MKSPTEFASKVVCSLRVYLAIIFLLGSFSLMFIQFLISKREGRRRELKLETIEDYKIMSFCAEKS